MIVSLLPANTTASPSANPPSTSFCGFVVSADRNTSAGRALLDLRLERRRRVRGDRERRPGRGRTRRQSSPDRAPSTSDAAPKIVRSAATTVGGRWPGRAAGLAGARTRMATRRPAGLGRRERDERRSADESDLTRGAPCRAGTSTMTFVALTTQTASSPTRRPSSSTASAVIRLTSRCGPAITSTTAATRSFSMRVTMPGKRLRADAATIGRSAACVRRSARRRVTSSNGTMRWPPAERAIRSRPVDSQRRSVSTETWSISAAWPTRSDGAAVRCVDTHTDGPWRSVAGNHRYLASFT